MYKVVYPFWDKKDKTKHEYAVGDPFPFDGREISQKRLESLTTENNDIGKILIVFEDEKSNNNPKLEDNLNKEKVDK